MPCYALLLDLLSSHDAQATHGRHVGESNCPPAGTHLAVMSNNQPTNQQHPAPNKHGLQPTISRPARAVHRCNEPRLLCLGISPPGLDTGPWHANMQSQTAQTPWVVHQLARWFAMHATIRGSEPAHLAQFNGLKAKPLRLARLEPGRDINPPSTGPDPAM
ncbi:uncharacterized protein B0I36DRAFT_314552 [Microdochium trichocladiopsis]|uniref:Uncharacterized protein n=1 Tax=Microdochium trichocladiopsis TaxID=1682393 RepID=A0A9P9BS90_9PEZI|nr:uncharacterized protein B0I36DRAFT_314552 [Microdochium trichocladiopsis]KAH7037660.1 hypothetical protein B0I36DRAFT_314552 [Microdochium trichocladiopsis]